MWSAGRSSSPELVLEPGHKSAGLLRTGCSTSVPSGRTEHDCPQVRHRATFMPVPPGWANGALDAGSSGSVPAGSVRSSEDTGRVQPRDVWPAAQQNGPIARFEFVSASAGVDIAEESRQPLGF